MDQVILEKLIITQLTNKFPSLMEAEGPLSCSKEPSTRLYTEPDVSSTHLPTLFL